MILLWYLLNSKQNQYIIIIIKHKYIHDNDVIMVSSEFKTKQINNNNYEK